MLIDGLDHGPSQRYCHFLDLAPLVASSAITVAHRHTKLVLLWPTLTVHVC